MKRVTIDIINEKALNLLRDLESMNLIRMRNEESPVDWSKFKGKMTKQPKHEIDEQLDELRNAWE
ncbi:hypothetical protein BH09BAC1_BH09BAC1_17280 [soil metagenome]